MTRLIDADAFIEKFAHVPMVQDAIKKAMDTMPTIDAEPHWIPCSERLPEENGVYLVTYEKDYSEEYEIYPIVSIAPFTIDKGFGDWVDDIEPPLGSGNRWWVDIPVCAWMPLPKPYEVEE